MWPGLPRGAVWRPLIGLDLSWRGVAAAAPISPPPCSWAQVVGMMEGANLSGDLADPARSIPLGTVAAVSTAFGCYILLIFGQAGTMDRGALQYDLNVLQQSCLSVRCES